MKHSLKVSQGKHRRNKKEDNSDTRTQDYKMRAKQTTHPAQRGSIPPLSLAQAPLPPYACTEVGPWGYHFLPIFPSFPLVAQGPRGVVGAVTCFGGGRGSGFFLRSPPPPGRVGGWVRPAPPPWVGDSPPTLGPAEGRKIFLGVFIPGKIFFDPYFLGPPGPPTHRGVPPTPPWVGPGRTPPPGT